MNKQMFGRVLFGFIVLSALVAIGILISARVSGQTPKGWRVWVKTSPCSGRTDWISVAKENPGFGGTGYYQTADLIQSPLKCTREIDGCTFAAAMAVADAVRTSPKFFDYCCHEYSVWENPATKEMRVVKGKFGTAGYDFPQFVKGDLCCEEAEAVVGKTGLCGGIPGGNNSHSCFASDPGAGAVNRNDHLTFAQQNEARLAPNLRFKIDLVFNCSSLSRERLDCAYAKISVALAKYVDAACFDGDQGAVSPDWAGHQMWARTQSRAQLLDGLQWKVATAFKCVAPANRASFFADLSVAIAQAPEACDNDGRIVITGKRPTSTPPIVKATPKSTPRITSTPRVVSTPSVGDDRGNPAAGRWELVSATVMPETPPQGGNNWSYNARSTSAQLNVYNGDRATFQWTPPPPQFDGNGFTVTVSAQAIPAPKSRIYTVIGVSGSGLTTDTPRDKQTIYVNGENGNSASGQTAVSFKPEPRASEIEVKVGMQWGITFTYKYRRAQ